ncbi:hypothetical protein PilKf_01857 [Pillotina sp. SPG140]
MNRISFFCIAMFAFFICFLEADDTPRGGGFTGPSLVKVRSIQEVIKMPHDADVIVEGTIEYHIKGKKYLFSDGTDTIVVEIDHAVWNGLSIGAEDIVRISGEIDRKFQRIEIEVESIAKKNN